MKTEKLSIEYGTDQEAGVDSLLQEMQHEGKVLRFEKEQIRMDTIKYDITFVGLYNVYTYGHRSAELWKYLINGHEKKDRN